MNTQTESTGCVIGGASPVFSVICVDPYSSDLRSLWSHVVSVPCRSFALWVNLGFVGWASTRLQSFRLSKYAEPYTAPASGKLTDEI